MMALPFTASCQRGHDRIEFTEREPFERHMIQVHKARKPNVGDATWIGSRRVPAFDAPRPGGLPTRYLRPSRAPKTTVGLTRVLAAHDHWGAKGTDGGRGLFAGVAPDWRTDERVPASELRAGDRFVFGRHEYTVDEVHEDTWTVTGTMNGLVRTTRLTERDAARLREAESVVIVKRAA